MLTFEEGYWGRSPDGILVGIDEAGRGPLAGDVYAGAVVIDRREAAGLLHGLLEGLTDSKCLTPRRREHYLTILEDHHAIRIAVGSASVEEIDTLNILAATHLAMRRAVLELGEPRPAYALVDGLPVRGLPCPSTALVGGDGRSMLIAAASVVAKVHRDRAMVALDRLYPQYGFASHKGYGTRRHLEALREHGPSPVHRRTFAPVAGLLQSDLWEDPCP